MEVAKQYMEFMGSEWVQTYRLNVTTFPSNSKVFPHIKDPLVLRAADMIKRADRVFDFYDRDTLPEMASVAMAGMGQFMSDPDSIDEVLARLEITRQEVFFGKVQPPVFFPASGSYQMGQVVNITTEGSSAAIFYTLDGTSPNVLSSPYEGPIELLQGVTTLKALAHKEGMKDSFIAQKTYSVYPRAHISKGTFYVVLGISIVSSIFVLNVSFFVHLKRDVPVMKASGVTFLQLMAFACVLNICSLLLAGLDTNTVSFSSGSLSNVCVAASWLWGSSHTLFIGCLVVKTWRVQKIFMSKKLTLERIPNSYLYKLLVGMVAAQCTIQVVWLTTNRLTLAYEVVDNVEVEACTSDNTVLWTAISDGYWVSLLIVALFLAVSVRNIPASFNESKSLAMTVYNMFVNSLLLGMVRFAMGNNKNASYILSALSTLLAFVVTFVVFLSPKIYGAIYFPLRLSTTVSRVRKVTEKFPKQSQQPQVGADARVHLHIPLSMAHP
jgi:hypothetical protein